MSEPPHLGQASPDEAGPVADDAEQAERELSVVLPAHNELSLLGSTVTNLLTGLDERGVDYELVIVENGSRDGTLQLARVLAAQLPRLHVLSLPVGDYGAALAAGFSAARGRVVVNFDVDYYDLAFLDTARRLLDAEGCAVVVASKRSPGAADRRPLVRRLLTLGFALFVKSLLGLRVSDTHGMKALDRLQLAPVVERCVLRGSMFDLEMVLRAERSGMVVCEVPAYVSERRPARTSVIRRTVESAVGVLHLRALLERETAGDGAPRAFGVGTLADAARQARRARRSAGEA